MEPAAKEAHKPKGKDILTLPLDAAALRAIQQAVSSIKFGVVQIIIQDGRIVQIDKTEKIRLT